MKRILFSIVIAVACMSCDSHHNLPTTKSDSGGTYEIVTIDGCEYLWAYQRMAHKGNCKNPIHCHNKLD